MRKIVLSTLLVLFACFPAGAQNQRVSGTVTGPDGNRLEGATVVRKDVNMVVAVTNTNGFYSAEVPPDAVLVFTFLGMETREVPVEGRDVINVQMARRVIQLENVVVTAAGIRRAERSLGYSVSRISPEEAIQRAEPDMLRSLEGKIPGFTINAPSGAAGSSTRVTIRGQNSFFGNNQPLYVVDGVPYSNIEVATSNRGSEGGGAYGSSISNLDPNDIASITILKSAASAALYGSRAANGVVVITTKSGSSGGGRPGLEVTFTGGISAETVGALPKYQNSYGQGSNFGLVVANGSWGPAFGWEGFEYVPESIFSEILNYYPNWAIDLYGSNDEIPYRAYPNNVKDLFDTGFLYETSVNVSSTNSKGNMGVTVSRTIQNGYVPESAYEKFSFGVGGSQTLNMGLRVGANLSYTRSIQDGSMMGNNQSQDLAVSSLGRTFILPRNWDIKNMPWQTPDGANLLGNLSSQSNNPIWGWKNNTIHTIEDRSLANFRLGYDILPWLAADYTIGYNHWALDRREVINIGSRGLANGRIRTVNYTYDEIESTLLLTGTHNFREDLKLTGIFGHNVNEQTTTERVLTGTDIIYPGVFSINNTFNQSSVERYARQAIWGMFLDAGLNYRDWAFLNVTGRNDWSSTLPRSNRSYFYPSVSASVIFTEALEIPSRILNYGKFRASWSKVGSDASPYFNNGYFGSDYHLDLTSEPAYGGQGAIFVPDVLYDENLKPEFTREFETGVDLGFFQNRLSVEFTYYTKTTDGQIAPRSLAPSSRFSSYYTNFGKVRNSGVEFTIGGIPVSTSYGLVWNVFWAFSKNKSKVLELTDGVEEVRLVGGYSPYMYAIVGQPLGIMKGTVIARHTDGTPLVDPDSGTYIMAVEDGFVGDPNPNYKTSLTNTFSYKGFTLGFMFDFQKGGCVVSEYLSGLLGRGVTKDTEDRLGTRIIPGILGDNNTKQAILDGNGNTIRNVVQIPESELWFVSSSGFSTFAVNGAEEMSVYDATVVRLSEVTIGYTLPQKWHRNWGVGSVHVSLVGRNLWFYAPNVPKYSNYDPTANSYGAANQQGYDYTGIPRAKRWGFNVSITF